MTRGQDRDDGGIQAVPSEERRPSLDEQAGEGPSYVPEAYEDEPMRHVGASGGGQGPSEG